MVRLLNIAVVLSAMLAAVPSMATRALAQSEQTSSAAEDPNDAAEHERSFEETRKHMKLHSEWSKKTGKMNNK